MKIVFSFLSVILFLPIQTFQYGLLPSNLSLSYYEQDGYIEGMCLFKLVHDKNT